ncbi:MAG: DUF1343 domain-containing protein [Bacteroidales bacterium]|jgi:uncharacterized protein YbbC (DUF1343 family)
MKSFFQLLVLLIVLDAPSVCSGKNPVPGAAQPDKYFNLIEGKSVAVVANMASMVGGKNIVDFLSGKGIAVRKIFAPEHGFRNMADAGENVSDMRDQETGLPVISLYGNHFKPSPDDLKGIDVVIFDIQDVGVRFYTYLSTLHYVMEACAENNLQCIVLDRPNPNGFYIDGNIPDTSYRSIVGLHPVPVVYGMTIGEFALMINGEGWMKDGMKCDLIVIKCKKYTYKSGYRLPVRPSPNLPDQTAVYLYPSLCFFEGTNISVGRGTQFPFEVYGSPLLPDKGFSFTPGSVQGAKNPPLSGRKCFGTDLRDAIKNKIVPSREINLEWLISAFENYPDKEKFFTPYFDVLAGGPELREQIMKGMNAEEIRETWKDGLDKFRNIRSKYLLYR